MEPPRIHCLLPPKEKFAAEGAGAQSLKILQTSKHSRYRDSITVFGNPTASPFSGVAFQPIVPFWPAIFGDKAALVRAYASAVRRSPPHLIECFNRPSMARRLAQMFPDVPVTVYIGNDAQTQLGARTVAQRKRLIRSLAGIYFVSEYVYSRFMDGISGPAPNVRLLRTGIERSLQAPPVKEKTIVFAGRVGRIKGTLEFAEAVANVLPRHPDWSAYLIGARWFKTSENLNAYERHVKAVTASSPNLHVTGFVPNTVVREHLRRAAIAVVPSNWEEPFARTALEALAEGCAVVASAKGGLVELGHRVRFLADVSSLEIERTLEDLICNQSARERLQAVAWNDFPYTIQAFSERWDAYRAEVLTSRRRPDHSVG